MTVVVPPVRQPVQQLADCESDASGACRAAAEPISRAIECVVSGRRLRVLREVTGHGVGRAIHEAPEVYNYYRR
jgi:methionyl aminopeptidase